MRCIFAVLFVSVIPVLIGDEFQGYLDDYKEIREIIRNDSYAEADLMLRKLEAKLVESEDPQAKSLLRIVRRKLEDLLLTSIGLVLSRELFDDAARRIQSYEDSAGGRNPKSKEAWSVLGRGLIEQYPASPVHVPYRSPEEINYWLG